ncbi:MAG: polyprenyl synthetase family protein [Chloroflexota bacterium]
MRGTRVTASTGLSDLQARYGPALDGVLSERLNGADDREFFGMMRYQFGYVDAELRSVPPAGGKRFRPLLCLLTCESVGGEWREALPTAAAIEMLHNFSLIHDDIEDHDPIRHHRPTVWKVWGESQAINTGDAVFAEAVRTVLASHGTPAVCLEVARRFGDVVLELTEGQYMDMSFETRFDVTPEEYMAMIERKTAELIAFSVWAGSRIGGAPEAPVGCFHDFGLELGKAFQIHDDILGIWAPTEVTGKERATDLINRKKTLPVLIAFERADHEQQSVLQDFYQRATDDVDEVLRILENTDARERSMVRLRDHDVRRTTALDGTGLARDARQQFETLASQLTGQ